MALIELCKLDSIVNVRPNQLEEEFAEQTSQQMDMNFFKPLQLALPPVGNPVDFMKQFSHTESGKPVKFDFQHGTTTLGFVYKGGVILAVNYGTKIINNSSNYNSDTPCDSTMMGIYTSGITADGNYWYRNLFKQLRLHELRYRERISIAAASKLMANMMFSLKGMGLSVGMLIGGYDKKGRLLTLLLESLSMMGDSISAGTANC